MLLAVSVSAIVKLLIKASIRCPDLQGRGANFPPMLLEKFLRCWGP